MSKCGCAGYIYFLVLKISFGFGFGFDVVLIKFFISFC